MSKKEMTIGVDIGGTNTAVGFVSSDGNCLFETTFATYGDEKITMFVRRLTEIIDEQYHKMSHEFVCIGMGIAAPNVNSEGILEGAVNLSWGKVDLTALMREYYDFPFLVINDANAAALGEMKFGVAKEMKNFIVVTIGTGVGAGIVINGDIYQGTNGFAGEVGHAVAIVNGRECGCGKKGCLETYVSANGIRRTVLELMSSRHFKSDLYNIGFQNLTAQMVAEAARKNDPLALEALSATGEMLGRKLADLVVCLDPEAIILMGGIIKAGELLLRPTRKHFEANLLRAYRGKVALIQSEMGSGWAAISGAAWLAKKYNEFRSN